MEGLYSWATSLYSWCTSLLEHFEGPNSEYFNDYFRDTPVCIYVFLAGLLIALVTACLYYFVVCNCSYILAKRYVWVITVFITFFVSFWGSERILIGHDFGENDKTGFYSSIETTRESLCEFADANSTVTSEINEEASNLELALGNGEIGLISEIAVANAFYTLLFYFIFSLWFKRYTIHGKAIPVSWF